ncbi:hypothetical protein [Stenotrophomonas geniculata]|uniref:hypothetical protein n=1 Tax=Stenotrophomonas geniculata TaxID=86188 RepID=UPI00122DC9B5|nr:hypothetical protein [Stenotrophomonas geniculata]
MKIGPAEGTPSEITEFFSNNGLDANRYFAVNKPTSNWLIIIPGLAFTATAIGLLYCRKNSVQLAEYIFIIGLVSTIWLACTLQTRFKSIVSTLVVSIGCVLVLLVAWGLLLPADVPDKIKTLSEAKK